MATLDVSNLLEQYGIAEHFCELSHSLTSTPLMLKMITDIRNEVHQLPSKFSSLYKDFINYQIDKSLGLAEDEKEILMDVFSNLAFELRNAGFISDSVDHLKDIIVGYVEEENCDKMANELLKSGLLVINSVGHGYDYVSFIHETFQEYFCSLYLAKYYLEHRRFGVDVTHGKWKETCRLAIEMLLPKLDKKETGNLLNLLRKDFYATSSNHWVDERLTDFVSLLSNSFIESPYVSSYVSQYVAANMDNYIHLDEFHRSAHLFEIIVNAVILLPNSQLYKRLFEDEKWLNEWLFLENEVEMGTSSNKRKATSIRKQKLKIFKHAVYNAWNKKAYFQAVICALHSYGYSYNVGKRLRQLVRILAYSLSKDEMKEIYRQRGMVFCLLLTMDCNFIEEELGRIQADLSDIDGSYQLIIYLKYSSTRDLDLLSYYYAHILPRFKEGTLVPKQLMHDLINCPGLLDRMIETSYWQNHFDELAKIVYVLPERYWTQKYNELIDERRQKMVSWIGMDTKKQKNEVVFIPVCSNNGMNIYTCRDINKTEAKDILKSLHANYPQEESRIIYIGRLEFVSLADKEVELKRNKYMTLDELKDKYPIVKIEKKENYVIFFELPENVDETFAKIKIRIENSFFRVTRSRLICISTSLKLHTLEYETAMNVKYIKKAKLMSSYFLYHRSSLLENMVFLKSFTAEELATLGIVGYIPEQLRKLIKDDRSNLFDIVGKKDKFFYVVGQGNNSTHKLRLPYYEDFEVGDTLLHYRDRYYKLHDVDKYLK